MTQLNAIVSFCEKETPGKTVTYLNINSIRLDGGTQQRTKLNLLHIQSLEDAIGEDPTKELEAIKVIFDGTDYWLVDGFHRYFAYKHSGRDLIPGIVDLGTQRDAILASVAANAENLALPRTRADKHKAVKTLLLDPEWSQKSDPQIADIAKVSRQFVTSIRKSLEVILPLENTDRVTSVTNANGTTFQRTIKAKTNPSNQFRDGNYGCTEKAKIEDFTARNGHIVPKSALGEMETPSEKSNFVDQPKPIQSDLKEWFLGFMARFYEFPDSYILAIEQKIKERKEMEALEF